MFGRKKGLIESGESWVYAGIYCEKHIPQTVKALGKAMLMIVEPANVSHDDRCSVLSCGGRVSFVAFRDVTWEMKQSE